MHLRIGTSGYAFPDWKGPFYPADLPNDQFLTYYAGRFPAVEINNTFYRMPREKVLLDWAAQVPDGFRFAVKASQKITHINRLKDVGELLGYLFPTLNVLGAKLGPTLFQLPPNFKLDLPRLDDFLARLPRRWKAALEFRHQSWFTDPVFSALKAKDMALCVLEQDEFTAPLVATATWGYVRLHRLSYDADSLRAWAAKLLGEPWEEAYVFFKHDLGPDQGSGPPAASAFMQAARA